MSTNVPKDVRRPVMDAARTGNPDRMDAALARIGDLQHLEGLRQLTSTEWRAQLHGSADILLGRLSTRMAALRASTPGAAPAVAAETSSPAPTRSYDKGSPIHRPTGTEVHRYGRPGTAAQPPRQPAPPSRPAPAPTVAAGGGRGIMEPLPVIEPELQGWVNPDSLAV